MNEEYEYSFKVKNIKDFLDYCENNNYKKEEVDRVYKKLENIIIKNKED